MEQQRLVVIGGGAAGMSAASAARRVDPGCSVTVLEGAEHAAWGLCGLPYYLSGMVAQAEDLLAYPPEYFRERRGIDLRLNTRATAVDAAAHRVDYVTADGTTGHLDYDRLIVTAGASPILPSMPGADDDRVFTLRDLEEARRLRKLLDGSTVRRALVVGGGYIGLEAAEALVARGCDVTVVELLDRVVPNLDAEYGAMVETEVRRHADLQLGAALTGIERRGSELRAAVGDVHFGVDVIVMAVGARPSGALLTAAGAESLGNGAVVVDAQMRTTLRDVFAAGDCVAVPQLLTGLPTFVPLGTTANKTGRVAGTVAAGGDAAFAGIVGTAVVKVFDLTVARTGLTLEEAVTGGIPATAADIEHRSRAKYYPGSVPVFVRLVFGDHGRLLGGQMVSADDLTAKRIDVIATALHARMTLSQVAALDLSYAPPYAPVYDPVIIAAEAASRLTVPAAVPA